MAIGWIDTQTDETAAQLKARLSGLHDFFKTSLHGGSTIAYSANGLILRQREDVKTEECRGLSEAAATLLKDLESDGTSSVIHYKAIGSNGEYAVVGIITGTKVTVSAFRANEAAGWNAVITTVTFSATDADGWTTTRPSSASSTGIVIDYEKTAERLSSVLKNGGSTAADYGIAVLYQNAAITTREYRFLTQAEAATLVATLNASRTGSSAIASFTYGNETTLKAIKKYTKKRATARYISAEAGWTVTCVETVYSPGAYYNNMSSYYWVDLSDSSNITVDPNVSVSFVAQGTTNSSGVTIVKWNLHDS